ncbi:MAG: hemerythrin domain-containing protein, partial [Candidatus Eremiobacteraeota bacterium]|nr:hemerythrin domain-containing protein [Candidatus Eremiobacteraeota bacterium]
MFKKLASVPEDPAWIRRAATCLLRGPAFQASLYRGPSRKARTSEGRRILDVLSLLKQDHRTVSALLDEATACEPDDDRLNSLAEEIESALTVHAAIEEKYFYPALRDRAEDSEDAVDVFEAYTEHELVKTLIALLKSGRQPDEQFKAEVQVLAENVKHHVKEEESTIFKLAREVLDDDELEELGETMAVA